MKKPRLSTKATKSGFTMVELSITMGFIAVLLITIAIVTTNLISIYQKGMTTKAVNSVGRGLIGEFTSAINTAPSVDTTSLCTSLAPNAVEACKRDHANKFIFQANRNADGEQLNGIFCTGYYSYIWNTYYSETADISSRLQLRYRNLNGEIITTEGTHRLMKIEDKTYRVCSAVMDGSYKSTLGANMTIDITNLANSTATTPLENRIPDPEEGMLNSFDTDMTFYEFTIFPISQDAVTLRTYMSGTFILATLRGDVDIMRTGDYCNPRIFDESGELVSGDMSTLGSEFNYCAINKFNFAARTAGV